MSFDGSLWGRRVLLTGLSPSASLSGFDAVIILDNIPTEAIDAGTNSAINGGGDLRFSTDNLGVNQLPLEVVTFVTNATPGSRDCELWIRFPTYASGAREVYMFYKKTSETQPAVGDAFGRNAVWADFIAVFHGQNVAGSIVDSAGNLPDGTVTGSVSNGSGVFGWGQSFTFDGTAGKISFGNLSVAGSLTNLYRQVLIKLAVMPVTNESIFGQDSSGHGWMMADNSDAVSGDADTYVVAGNARDDRDSTGANSADLLPHVLGNRWANGSAGGEPLDGYNTVLDGAIGSPPETVIGFVATSAAELSIGGTLDFSTLPIDGDIQECWFLAGTAGIFVTDDKIASINDNQSSPSTFWDTGTPETPGDITITPTGIPSSEAFGTPVILQEILITPTGFGSSQQFGKITLVGDIFVIEGNNYFKATFQGVFRGFFEPNYRT